MTILKIMAGTLSLIAAGYFVVVLAGMVLIDTSDYPEP